eukprot:gene6696-9452_t
MLLSAAEDGQRCQNVSPSPLSQQHPAVRLEQPRAQERSIQSGTRVQAPLRGNPREPLLNSRGHPRYTPEQIEAMRQAHLQEVERQERELELKYGAESVLALIKPVSVCMIVVIATIRSVSYFSTNDTQFVYTPYESRSPDASNTERFGGAILNALIIIGIVVAMTCVLLVLYKYRCDSRMVTTVIPAFTLLFQLSFSGIQGFFVSLYYPNPSYGPIQVLLAYNASLDWITAAVTIWNFGVAGLMCIHWRGPLVMQQIYLVLVSALMALVLIKNLPDWTTWVVLAAIAIYDLVAVLSPCGPLKALVETAQERDEPLFPALIYSSGMAWIVSMADRPEMSAPNRSRTASSQQVNSRSHHELQELSPQQRRTSHSEESEQRRNVSDQEEREEQEEEKSGVKLGLGDFIFYSVLVGKAATANEWTTIISSYVGILIVGFSMYAVVAFNIPKSASSSSHLYCIWDYLLLHNVGGT